MDKAYLVGVWCAVSSKPQASPDKISLEAQEQAGRRFAAAIGGAVVRVYTVPGHSRDLIFWSDAESAMPAYRDLRADAEAGAINVLHVVDADRLGRDPALSNQVVSLCEHHGVEVYFADHPHQLGQRSVSDRYVFAITSTRAQEDNLRRIGHLKRGMAARARRGLHCNNWPTGYHPIRDNSGRVVGGEFSDLAGAVRLATDLYLRGESLQAIAAALDTSPYQPQHGRAWHRAVVGEMLLNDTYAGIVAWGDAVTPAPSDRFPALWDAATWAAVQRERARRLETNHRHGASMFLYVAFCATCNAPLYRVTRAYKDTQYGYLRCDATRNDGDSHHTTHTSERRICQALTAYLQAQLTDEVIEIALQQRQQPRVDIAQRIADIERRAAEVEQQRDNLALNLAAGVLPADVYTRTEQTLSGSLGRLKQEQITLQAQLDAVQDVDATRQAFGNLRARVANLWTLPPKEVNTLLRDVGIRVLVEGNKIAYIGL